MNQSLFHEVTFPVSISSGSTGGPERQTDILMLGSGIEMRSSRWAHSKRRYDAGTGIKTLGDLATIVAFFEERRGQLYGFRWHDAFDDRSSAPCRQPGPFDQLLGNGDGKTRRFQLVKYYGASETAYKRPITKPIRNSLLLAINGKKVDPSTRCKVNWTNGVVDFIPEYTPEIGAIITAGFEFHVPVRFDTKWLKVDIDAFNAGQINSIPIVEIAL